MNLKLIMCLNMCKQILEKKGFSHSSCVFMPEGSFFKTAGVFEFNGII